MASGFKPDAGTQLMKRCHSESHLITPNGISHGQGIKGIIGSDRLKILKDMYNHISDDEYPTTINLSKNNFKNQDLVQFIQSFREKLEIINLSDNNVG